MMSYLKEVTFETKCWENDYRLILDTNHLKRMIDNCSYPFKYRQLIINNVDNIEKCKNKAQQLIDDGILTDFYVCDDSEEKVLNYFDIDKSSFNGGFYYSISELTGIFNCKTKYLLHFSSDSYIPKEYNDVSWINDAIKMMENNSDIVCANPTWNYKFDEAKKESFKEENEFLFSQGFSDQCYLINAEVFKDRIYNYYDKSSDKYPKHGGDSFEKRVHSFLKQKNKYRITTTKLSYVSKNITTKQKILEKIHLINI